MPRKSDNSPPDWEIVDDECQIFPVSCPWTIASKHENLSLTITCLKWTSNDDLWIRAKVYPEENPQVAKQVDRREYSPLVESLSDALSEIYDSTQPHLTYYQLHIFGKLNDYFDSKFP